MVTGTDVAVAATHPLYDAQTQNWQFVADFYAGTQAVKDKGTTYLPATAGHVLDGITTATDVGMVNYIRYKEFAVVPDYVREAVESMQGYLHRKPATFELPDAMKYMLEKATPSGDSLQMLLALITEQQLKSGRVGLLLDLPLQGSVSQLPYIALYNGDTILNWDSGVTFGKGNENLNLVVLNESNYRREGFNWKYEYNFRVLVLGDMEANEPGEAAYRVGVFGADDNLNNIQFVEPSYKGERLSEIPFVFVNSSGNKAEPCDPPLLGLTFLVQSIYRGEADYRYGLHLQAQDTLVIVNGQQDEITRVGAGSKIEVQLGGDAKYIGVSSTGLPEQRLALEAQRREAMQKVGLLLTSVGSVESDATLKTKVSSQTITLTSIVTAAATGLQRILRIQAKWMGEDPDKVVVVPNTEFIEVVLAGDELVKLAVAKREGVTLSYESIHALMQKRGLTSMSFADEQQAIAKEPKPEPDPNLPNSTNSPVNQQTNSTAPGLAEARGVKDGTSDSRR